MINPWSEETKKILSWWSDISVPYRVLLAFVPRNHRSKFDWFCPPKINAQFWALEEKIFRSPTKMVRIADSSWQEIQVFLKIRILD